LADQLSKTSSSTTTSMTSTASLNVPLNKESC
jgi:hypothetical protein